MLPLCKYPHFWKGMSFMEGKLSGSYYTPIEIVRFTYNYLANQNKSPETILEPSVGDGRFFDTFLGLDGVERLVGVELYQEKINELLKKNYPDKVELIASDFLKYTNACEDKFQLIIGNPPYINIKNMEKDFLDTGRAMCQTLKLPESLMQNSWVAFVLASIKLVEPAGAIFFVLPTEFLQVQYAEKLRLFLEEKFNTIHIITFVERMFPEIEQEACLVYLTNAKEALPYISYKQYEKLNAEYDAPLFESRIERNKPLKKWSNAMLSDYDIDLLNRVAGQYKHLGALADSAPGIVTAANNKFILTENEVQKYACRQLVIPIISKGMMARGIFEINDDLIAQLAQEGKKVYMLNLANTKEDDLPNALKDYLSDVATTKRNNIEIQNSYKCSKRKPWYAIPVVKSGKVVFFKRYDLCPRMSTNPKEIHTTDIAYNLQLKDKVEAESLVFCFYNSLTLAQCEFMGRYYAGGVSEMTPSEFRAVHVPYRPILPKDILKLNEMFKKDKPLDDIIAFVNSKTISLDLQSNEITTIDSIRERLIKRRK